MLDWCLLLCRTHVLLSWSLARPAVLIGSLCAVMPCRDTVGSGVGFGTTKSQGVDKELAELARRKLTFIEVPTSVASEVALCSLFTGTFRFLSLPCMRACCVFIHHA